MQLKDFEFEVVRFTCANTLRIRRGRSRDDRPISAAADFPTVGKAYRPIENSDIPFFNWLEFALADADRRAMIERLTAILQPTTAILP